MTVDVAYKLMNFIINKNQNGDYPPDSFNITINAAQRSYVDFLVGQLQSFQYGKQIPRVALGQSQNVRTRLTPFISAPTTLSVNSSTGIAPYPTGYLYFDAMVYSTNKRVKEVQQDRLAEHANSTIDPVASNPFFMLVKEGFKFYPSTISTPSVSFVKNPDDIKYAYTLDSNQRPVYDSGNSVQPLWGEMDMLEVIARALAMVGVNLQFAQVQQYANMIKTQGQ